MVFGGKNDRERIAALASAKARDCSETVSPPNITSGAVNLDQLSQLLLANQTVCCG
jgi:hypothetical protein